MNKTVLLGEDDTFFRAIIRTALSQAGYVVIEAVNGEEVVNFARNQHPDVILLDLIMPVKDGFTAMTELSEDEELKKIPVIITSSLEQPEDMEKVMSLGAKSHIAKSDPRAIVAEVSKLLQVE